MRATAALLLTVLPATTAAPASPYDSRRDVEARLASRPLDPVEGVWRFPESGAVVAIESDYPLPRPDADGTPDAFTMVIIRAPRRSILPGTVMGRFTATAEAGVYKGTLMTDHDGGTSLLKPRKVELRLDPGQSRLTFRQLGSKISLSPRILIPYLWRAGVRITTREDPPEGCIKLYPPTGAPPQRPVYL